MTESPAGPGFTAPGFSPCYRHADRMTGINCQRCGKPICGECMNPASVGFQCPQCVSSGKRSVRQPTTKFGATIGDGRQRATVVVMAVLAGVWVLDFASRGLLTELLIMHNASVAYGQFWRLVTSAVVSGSLFGLLMNLLVLWIAGRAMEAALGGWRFVVLFLTAGLGGMTVFFVLGPWGGFAYGASSAIFGLLGANAVGKAKTGEDIRPDIGLLVLVLLYNVYVGFATFGWLSLIGGIIVGGVSGAILAYAPRQNRMIIQVVGMLALVVVCLAAVVAKIVVV